MNRKKESESDEFEFHVSNQADDSYSEGPKGISDKSDVDQARDRL
jgi:hypothetical protein